MDQKPEEAVWQLYEEVCRSFEVRIPEEEWAEVVTWSVVQDVICGARTLDQARSEVRAALRAKFGHDFLPPRERLDLGLKNSVEQHHREELAKFRAWQILRDLGGAAEFRARLGIAPDASGYIEPGDVVNALLHVVRTEMGDESLRTEDREPNEPFLDVGNLVRTWKPFLRVAGSKTLMELERFTKWVSRESAMSEPEALALILANVIPEYRYFEIEHRASVIKSRYDRIIMVLDPSLGSNDVKKLYSDARKQLAAHDRPATESTLELVEFFRNPANAVLSGEEFLWRWNEHATKKPGSPKFKRFSDLKRAAERGERSLLDPAKTRKPREER